MVARMEDEIPVGGSMYDRVKRRSSGLNKDEEKSKVRTLELIREQQNKKKQRSRIVQFSSGDEDGEEGKKVINSF